ncbi:hypothetical protein LTR64_008491 [Lithohypha guttulata]|uniref:uncharacterized protein n=1 Tax=Lithohypha guttulata TaxID=1690604 RepID=UPI002DDF44BC|nr:hypothetical protein LTR51_001744 [Lithohypha guttulata]
MKEASQDSSEMSAADFMETFLIKQSPPQESIDYFKSVPWLAKHISNPAYKIVPTFSRHLKTSGEDYYFSRTINTEQTMPHMISLQLRNFVTPDLTEAQPRETVSPERSHTAKTIVPENPDCLFLISVGPRGLDGHPLTIHGGVTCAILDETMGFLIMLHDNNLRGPGPRDSLYTANLNVSYRAPVSTPGELLVKTWLVKRQGRKWYCKGQLVDMKGTVLAEADGLWVTARREKM